MLSRDLLFAMNDIKDSYLEDARKSLDCGHEKKTGKTIRRVSRALLLAALISLLLVGSAYAAGIFSLRESRPAKADETYSIHWGEDDAGLLTWHDLKYVFTFEGLDECKAVKFRPGWLPFQPVYSTPDEEGFYTHLVSEGAPEVDYRSGNYQPYRVDVYYVPQFAAEDGAMLLMYQTPGEISQEQWGDETVLKFEATQHFEAREGPAGSVPEHTGHYYFVIRFSEAEGYIVVTSGTSDMETVERVARELEIVQTGETVRTEDFVNHAVFIDVGQG